MKYYILSSWAGGCYPHNRDRRAQVYCGYGKKIDLEWLRETIPDFVVPPPLKYEVNIETAYRDTFKAAYYAAPMLFRNDLVEAILSAEGVDNVQVFDAIVTDKSSGQAFTNYKLLNISYEEISETNIEQGIDVAEHILRVGAILYVDEIVKNAIEAAGIENVQFQGTWKDAPVTESVPIKPEAPKQEEIPEKKSQKMQNEFMQIAPGVFIDKITGIIRGVFSKNPETGFTLEDIQAQYPKIETKDIEYSLNILLNGDAAIEKKIIKIEDKYFLIKN
jgi:hypothetical protein